MVAVRARQRGEFMPAVGGAVKPRIEHVKRLHVLGIGEDMRVIPGALAEAAVLVHPFPFFAAVLGAIESSVLGLDQRIDAASIRPRNRNADAAEQPLWQTVPLKAFPGASAVGGLIEAAARAAAGQTPWRAAGFPECGEQDVRVRRVKADVDRAGLVVLVENSLPGFSAVG